MTLAEALRGKRFGVVLSAGYFGFYGHTGFVGALEEASLVPAAWAGTSAGGMVAAFAAAGLTAKELEALVLSQRREHFWDPDYLGIAADALRHGHRPTGLLKGTRFRELMARHLPVQDFAQLRAPLVLVATNLGTQEPQVLREGDLPSAIHATCAYPGLFQAVRRDGALLWDGGIVDKAPALALHRSPAGVALEALVIHHLPSRDGASEPKGAFAWPAGIAAGFAAVRKEQFRLQLELLAALGVTVHVVSSTLPPVTPGTMARGRDALEAGRESMRLALGAPAQTGTTAFSG